MDEAPEHFRFLLLPGVPLAPLASAVDVLALANYVSGKHLYAWGTVAEATNEVESMNGFRSVVDWQLDAAPPLNAITVCCGIGGSHQKSRAIRNWLRNRHRKGASIGAISTGSWLLARAGLLDGKRCTIGIDTLSGWPRRPGVATIAE